MIPTFFPGSQRVLRTGGGYINCLRGAFHQKHAPSTIEGNGIVNTMTQAHLEGPYICRCIEIPEGTKSIEKMLRNVSKIRRFATHSHTSITRKAQAD